MTTESPPSNIHLSVARYYALQKTHAPQLCRAGVLLLYHHEKGNPYRWAGHRGTHRLLIDFFTAREGHLNRIIRYTPSAFGEPDPKDKTPQNGLSRAMARFENAYLNDTAPPPVVEYSSTDNLKFDRPKPIRRTDLQALLELVKANIEYIQSRQRPRRPAGRAGRPAPRSSGRPPMGKPTTGRSEPRRYSAPAV
jgi:hypothetical protein